MAATYEERLRAEFAKVPEGCPYYRSPNFPELWRLLRKGTPYIKQEGEGGLMPPATDFPFGYNLPTADDITIKSYPSTSCPIGFKIRFKETNYSESWCKAKEEPCPPAPQQ